MKPKIKKFANYNVSYYAKRNMHNIVNQKNLLTKMHKIYKRISC